MLLQPKRASNDRRVDAGLFPPSRFVAATVDLAMMSPAQRHDELVAHFAPEGLKLREPKMMSVRRLAAADQTRLLGNESNVVLIPDAARL